MRRTFSGRANGPAVNFRTVGPKKYLHATHSVACLLHLLDTLENFTQISPILFHAFDVTHFIRRVWILDRWSERYHVQSRIVAADDATFESSVDGADMRFFAKHFLVDILHQPKRFRFGIRLPTWIASAVIRRRAS